MSDINYLKPEITKSSISWLNKLNHFDKGFSPRLSNTLSKKLKKRGESFDDFNIQVVSEFFEDSVLHDDETFQVSGGNNIGDKNDGEQRAAK